MTQKEANLERANRIGAQLDPYLPSHYGSADEASTRIYLERAIVDVLSDIRHLCDREGLSFGEVDRKAYAHYATELAATD